MKKLISLILILSIIFSFSSCSDTSGKVTSSSSSTVEEKAEVEDLSFKQSEDVVYEKPDNPLSAKKIAKIPIANNNMTSKQLRQICVDYMKLSVNCQWVADGTYYIWKKSNPEMNFTEGKLYGGLPYIHKASGNLYRFMEYYDEKTGVFDSSGLRANPNLFASACSGTAGWAWSRVVNSAVISWTYALNAANGFIPVGPYKYDYTISEFWKLDENGDKVYKCNTLKVCEKNGKQTMYESYASTLLADCYTRNGHVAMAVTKPVVRRFTNGKIDGTRSYVYLAEQGQYTTSDYHLRTTSDGTEYRIRGNDGKRVYFTTLYKLGYIVHTFKEFHGIDPVEKGEANIDFDKSEITIKRLTSKSVTANYPISDIFTKVYNSKGKEVFSHIYRAEDYFTREFETEVCLPIEDLKKYTTGEYTLKITSQLSNGEVVKVYEGVLIQSKSK